MMLTLKAHESSGKKKSNSARETPMAPYPTRNQQGSQTQRLPSLTDSADNDGTCHCSRSSKGRKAAAYFLTRNSSKADSA